MGQPLVTSLLRGLEVLRCFTEQKKVLGSSEIARLTRLPQPTVWRLCQTLVSAGYLAAEPNDGGFRLGLGVLTLGFSAISALDLADLVRPDLQKIANTFGAAAGLTSREGLSMLCLQRFEATDATLTVNWRIGSMVPIVHSGVGWAYLAGLSEGRRKEFLAEIGHVQPEAWRKASGPLATALKDYQRAGYVVNADIMYPGMTTVALPVERPSDRALFVLNCTGLSAMISRARIARDIGPALKAAAKRLAMALAGGAGQ